MNPEFGSRSSTRCASSGTSITRAPIGSVPPSGDGMRRVYRVLAEEARLTTVVERARIAPWGFDGGEDGQPSAVWLERGGKRKLLRGKGSVELRRDDVVVVETAGGGGFGSGSG